MTVQKPRAVLVGDATDRLQPYFVDNLPEWDFHEPYCAKSQKSRSKEHIAPNPAIIELARSINDDENDEDYEVIILNSMTFDPAGGATQLEELVADLAPYAMMCILDYHPTYHEQIIARVEEASKGQVTREMFYFIPKDDFVSALRSCTDDFIERYERAGEPSDTADILRRARDARLSQGGADDRQDDAEGPATPTEHHERGAGRIVAVTSSKGGAGKSTTAISLATHLALTSKVGAEAGEMDAAYKVLLVDLDVHDAQIGSFTGYAKPNVMGIYSAGVSAESLSENIIHDEAMGLDLLLGARNPLNAENLGAQFYEGLLTELTHHYDYIVLDTSISYRSELISEVAYPMADTIVFVTEPIMPSVGSMVRWIRYVTGDTARGYLGLDPEKIVVDINKYMAVADERNLSEQELLDATSPLTIATVTPSVPTAVAKASNGNRMEDVMGIDGIRMSMSNLSNIITDGQMIDDATYLKYAGR